MKYLVIAVVILLLLIPFVAMFKSGRFFRNLLISAFQGIAALLAVNALGLLTGITIAFNRYTIAASVILGIPACISMLLIDILF